MRDIGAIPYPPSPEPHTVEVEATNACNAACSFCPHDRMTRPRGYLDPTAFDGFVTDLAGARDSFWLNRIAGGERFPRVVFAGLGEPTLHRKLSQLVHTASARRFPTQVVTNGSRLSADLVDELVDAELTSLAISLHTLDPEVYRLLLHLDLDLVLPRVEAALQRAEERNLDVQIWRVLPPPGQRRAGPEDDKRFRDLLADHPTVEMLGPSEPWSRDGTVASRWPVADDDPASSIWCHKLYLTHNIAWDGTAVMCCVDYHRITTPLGNVFTDGYEEVQRRRAEVLAERRRPAMCGGCRRWRDTEYPDIVRTLQGRMAGLDAALIDTPD